MAWRRSCRVNPFGFSSHDNLDTLRDCVLEHGLTWDENPNGSTLYDLREAIRAYRTARDS